ncbi:MAG: SAM-dependent methyltransferase, partial [Gammaproteobacteria bacterium]|nr:SAM-dependent methyltransferase [Gammaproteobacteria bacterium]
MQALTNKQLAPPLLSIFILSGSALAYEVLLIRLFSIVHWHHFAFMVISIALLGYGISGSFITVFRDRLLNNYYRVFISNIVLFGLSSIACFIAVQQLPFNALEILWDSSQWQRLLLSYLLLTLPFFFVANAMALTMMRFHQQIPLVYGIDLIGAGLGAVSVMALLQILSPDTLLRVLAISGLAAGFFALSNLSKTQRQITMLVLLLCIAGIFMAPQKWLDLRLSQYKGLSQTLLMKDVSLRDTHSSPISQTDVVQSPFIPFRNAPGLSLQSPAGPPEQLAVFRDGDEMTT